MYDWNPNQLCSQNSPHALIQLPFSHVLTFSLIVNSCAFAKQTSIILCDTHILLDFGTLFLFALVPTEQALSSCTFTWLNLAAHCLSALTFLHPQPLTSPIATRVFPYWPIKALLDENQERRLLDIMCTKRIFWMLHPDP
jgi:hypothetical protein